MTTNPADAPPENSPRPPGPAGARSIGRVIAMLGRIGLPALRGSLGVVFGWFGILKLAAVPPVADLVTAVLDIAWIDPLWAAPALGRSAQLVPAHQVVGG